MRARNPFPWRDALRYLATAMAAIGAYDAMVQFPFPFRIFTANNLFFEYPVVALVLLGCYFPKVKTDWLSVAAPLGGVGLVFGAFDLFFHYLRRSPRPSDFENLLTVADFAPALIGCAALLAALIVAAAGWQLRRVARAYPPREFRRALLLRLLVLGGGATALAAFSANGFAGPFFQPIFWSEELAVRINGRISSFLYYGEIERLSQARLQNYTHATISPAPAYFPGAPRRRPNIHLIVLESFLDPRLLRSVGFSRSPLADELRPFLHEGARFSQVTSPVYGGNSAQAEFELLTGVRAFGRVSTAEFNVMRGGAAQGFVRSLKAAGYRSMATIASRSSYFNARAAYRSIGLDEARFLADDTGVMDEPVLFDGALFAANLAIVRRLQMAPERQPLFNYVVGMYSHFPFERNYAKRPDVVTVHTTDDRVARVANQFYYRTRALGRYLRQLRAMDPDAIIYVTSDHLPPIIDPSLGYAADRRTNSALLLIGGQPVDVSSRSYYEIPWLLWDRLTEQNAARPSAPEDLEQAYYHLLWESRQHPSSTPAAR